MPRLDLGVADDAVSTAELAETRRVGESCMALGRALMAMSVSVGWLWHVGGTTCHKGYVGPLWHRN